MENLDEEKEDTLEDIKISNLDPRPGIETIQNSEEPQKVKEETIIMEMMSRENETMPIIRSPYPSRVISENDLPASEIQLSVPTHEEMPVIPKVEEIVPEAPHFIPQKVRNYRRALIENQVPVVRAPKIDKYPKILSWLNEFERSTNG